MIAHDRKKSSLALMLFGQGIKFRFTCMVASALLSSVFAGVCFECADYDELVPFAPIVALEDIGPMAAKRFEVDDSEEDIWMDAEAKKSARQELPDDKTEARDSEIERRLETRDVFDRMDPAIQYLPDMLVNTDSEITGIQASENDGGTVNLAPELPQLGYDFFSIIAGQQRNIEVMKRSVGHHHDH